ncbi:hypothetical protein AMELA_G00006040 [Ameiurus melas]|uniref:Small ribosomal subunit protein bS16m n=1 Tax=Ameiurus melas TaxID=219545 RepID=A0A7J6BF79_AMEME|nr:hypothetical protein AMELA_G00006040 [Ameiurus melas]
MFLRTKTERWSICHHYCSKSTTGVMWARDGKYIEQLGSYDPLPNIYNEKLVAFNYDRIKYWMGCGAHPTKPVAKLLGLAGFFPLHPMTITEAERQKAAAALKQEETSEDEEEKQAEQ